MQEQITVGGNFTQLGADCLSGFDRPFTCACALVGGAHTRKSTRAARLREAVVLAGLWLWPSVGWMGWSVRRLRLTYGDGRDGMLGWMDRMERSRRDCSTRSRILGACWHPGHFPKRELHVADEKMNGRAYFFLLSFRCPLSLSSPSLHLATMSPPPPPPPPPFCLPSFTRKGKKKKLDEYFDEKSASHLSGSRSRGSRGSRSSLPASQRPSQRGSPLAHSLSYSPTATITDAQSRVEITSRAEKLTFSEDSESYSNLPRMAPKLDRSRSKLTRGDTLRKKLGYGWTLGLGRKDKDKEDLFTEVDRSSSATTILPVYPRDSSFLPEDSRGPTRHVSQRSKTSQRSNDTQASRATKSSNLSNGSKQSNNSKRPSLNGGGSLNTLVGSAIERKEAYQDPIREYVDTYARLTELRKFMAKESLDY